MGMGGGLLQAWNRDTLKYAMKASAIKRKGEDWVGFAKDPITDSGKQSKQGRLGLVFSNGIGSGTFKTLPKEFVKIAHNELRVVYRNGEMLVNDTFDEIRVRAELKENEYINAYSRYDD